MAVLEQELHLAYSSNVTELRRPNQTAFDGLNEEQRVAFVKANYGFLQDVSGRPGGGQNALFFLHGEQDVVREVQDTKSVRSEGPGPQVSAFANQGCS